MPFFTTTKSRGRLRSNRFGLLLALVLFTPALDGQAGVSEKRLKAEFIKRFASFTVWPDKAIQAGEDLVVCSGAGAQIVSHLRTALGSAEIQGHRVRVVELKLPEVSPACDVLFIPVGAAPMLQATLEAIENRPVLTIGDSTGFGERGLMLNLYTDDRRIKFEVNEAQLRSARLKLPAKVLRLGKKVRTR